jgi:hypothetical protein
MIYIELLKLQKTVLMALALVGAYSDMLLLNGNVRAAASSSATLSQAQSVMPEDSTVRRTYQKGGVGEEGRPRLPVQVAETLPTPPDRGAPGQRQGAATRTPGKCGPAKQPLTALVPITRRTWGEGQGSSAAIVSWKSVLGSTVAERPTFWFYVPYTLTPAHRLEFVLRDETGNDIYKTSFTQSGTSPTVVGVELPSTAAPLEVGKMYNWSFLIECSPAEEVSVEEVSVEEVSVNGWVQRVPINALLERQLEQATPKEKIALYANNHIWHEALTSLAELRRQNPEDDKLKEDWVTLLQLIDLNAIAQEPITLMLTPGR